MSSTENETINKAIALTQDYVKLLNAKSLVIKYAAFRYYDKQYDHEVIKDEELVRLAYGAMRYVDVFLKPYTDLIESLQEMKNMNESQIIVKANEAYKLFHRDALIRQTWIHGVKKHIEVETRNKPKSKMWGRDSPAKLYNMIEPTNDLIGKSMQELLSLLKALAEEGKRAAKAA